MPHVRFIATFAAVLFLSFPGLSFAQSFIPANGVVGSCNFITGDLHFDCVPTYIGFVIKILLGFAAGFFLTGLLIAGYRYTIGSVTTEGKEAGKKQIIACIGGFCVVILSYLIVDTVIAILTQ